MDYAELKSKWLAEEREGFKGWDFSHLDGRWECDPLPWDYRSLVQERLRPEHALLDMGTGGGEFLLTLNHPYSRTSVTEAWEPNIVLCRERLEPLGITVGRALSDSSLPFGDGSFDIVINRHESYDAKEISRVLKRGGWFVTQQVGEENNGILSRKLIEGFSPRYAGHNLNNRMAEMAGFGFDVRYAGECFPVLRFYDVGAVVYFAGIIEWEFPGFSVEKCFDRLCRLQEELISAKRVESREHRFIIVAKFE